MKIRKILLIAVSCIVTETAFGQTRGYSSRWGTDGAAAKTAMAVMLDLRVDASGRVSGSITEYGNALCGSPDSSLPIDDGIAQGNIVTFVTTRPNPCPAPGTAITPGGPGTVVTWTGTLGNDDSLSVTRANSGVRGSGGAPGAAGPQNPPAASASRNPVSAGGNPVQGTTPPIQGVTNPPIQPQGRGIAAPRGGGGRGGGALVMHRL